MTKQPIHMKIITTILCCFFCFTSNLAFSWGDVPHILIVEIAKPYLNAETLQCIDEIVEDIDGEFPRAWNMADAACWADDVTQRGLNALNPWHEILLPYDPEGLLTDKEHETLLSRSNGNTICFALREAVNTLKNPNAGPWEKNFMLRILLHCLGDIHNPLHCASLYNFRFPNGDCGGKLFLLDHDKDKTLRQLWDSMLGGARDHWKENGQSRFLTIEDQEEIRVLIKKIITEYPPANFPEIQSTDFYDWANESHQLAVKYAYNGIKPGNKPSMSYLENCRSIAFRQVALASYRLAKLLNEIFVSD